MLPVTYQHLQKRKKEIEEKLPHITNEISIARERGDLRENFEYKAAKETKYNMDKELTEINRKIINAHIIDNVVLKEFITFGNTVVLEDLNTNKEFIYEILGEEETDISNGIISCDSLLGRNLLGKKTKDQFTFQTPGGEREFLIKSFFIA